MLHHNRPMLARLSAFVIWAAVAGTAVFWGLRLWVKAPAAPAGVLTVEAAAAARGDLTRLFGSAPPPPIAVVDAPPPESSRYRLSGLMSPRQSGTYGVALIAIDGKAPRAYKVGARVDGEMLLRSVSLRSATVAAASGGSSFTLELPPLLPPTTGQLPPAINSGLNAPPPPNVPSVQGLPGAPIY